MSAGPRAVRALVAVALVALAAWATPAAAQEPPAGAITFEGIAQTPWVTRTGLWSLQLAVAGAPPGATVTADIYERVTTREAAVAAQYAVLDGDVLGSLPDVDLDAVDTDDQGRREVSLAVSLRQDAPAESQPGWAFFSAGLRPGVYPVDVRVVDADGTERGRIIVVLTRVPSDEEDGASAPPLLVAPVVRLGGPPTIEPDGAESRDRAAARRAATLASGLGEAEGLPLTLIPRPETIEGLARDATGTTTIAGLRDELEQGQVVDGPYVDVALDAWVARGMTDELTRQRDRGNGVLREHLGRIDSSTWDASDGLTTAGVAALWPVGVRTVLLGRDALGPGIDSTTGPYAIDAGPGRTVEALLPDASASDALVRRDDPVLDAASLAAELALLVPTEGPARGVVLVAPEQWPSDPEAVALLDDVLTDDAAPVTAVTLEGLLDRPTGTAALVPVAVPDLGTYPDLLAQARGQLGSLTSMVGAEDPEVASLDQRLLLSGARTLAPEGRDAYLAAVLGTTGERFGQVVAPERQTYTLTSSDGSVPLTLLNEHDAAVEVVIELRSGTGGVDFRDGARIVARLEPGPNTLSIPVRARTFGDSTMDMVVRTPDGAVVLDQVRYTVRSTAIPRLGLILSGGAAAFLVIWWARHWRKDRRRRREAAADDDPGTPTDPTA